MSVGMDANEESEIAEGFSRALRMALTSGMQGREAMLRRQQTQEQAGQRQTQQQQATEAKVADVLRQDAYSKEFWRTATTEQIADQVTVAGHLSQDHPAARSAYLHMSDVLRDDYGINIEQMNRDHPTSAEDRHAALRDALDDYYAKHRLDAEADQGLNQAQAERESAELSAEAGDPQDAEAAEQRAEHLEAGAQQSAAQAESAASSEQDHLAEAERRGSEVQQDSSNTLAEEQGGGRAVRQPEGATAGEGSSQREGRYERVSEQQLTEIAKVDPRAAEARRITRQNFPASASDRVGAARSPQARKNVGAGRSQRTRTPEVTR